MFTKTFIGLSIHLESQVKIVTEHLLCGMNCGYKDRDATIPSNRELAPQRRLRGRGVTVQQGTRANKAFTGH